jgi:diguanylate cyclase (GGDEF)-like protein
MDSLHLVSSQHLTTEKFTSFPDESALSAAQKLSMMELLQGHEDTRRILQEFAAEAATYVDLAAVRLNAGDVQMVVEVSKGQRYYRSFNLSSHSNLYGTLTIMRNTPFSRTETGLLKQLVDLLQIPMKQSLMLHRLKRQIRQDYLTGIGNRAHFDESLAEAIDQQSRSETGMVLVLLDLNKFKQINDTLGHQIGDDILVKFSLALKHAIRGGDKAFRLGGDEFALLLQPARQESVTKIAQRIHQWLTNDPMTHELNVSASVGYAIWEHGMNAAELINLADQAMYRHKFAN